MKRKIIGKTNRLLSFFNAKIVPLNRPNISLYSCKVRPEQPRYLNIGAGKWAHPLWHNLDNPRLDYEKSLGLAGGLSQLIQHDLTADSAIPLKTGSLRCTFTSHTIEHLDYQSVKRLLTEAHRMLENGGVLRVVCPDIDLFINAYFRGDKNFLVQNSQRKNDYSQESEQIVIAQFGSALSTIIEDCGVKKLTSSEFRENITRDNVYSKMTEYLRRIPKSVVQNYPRNHDSWWNERELVHLFKECGFKEAYSSRFGQSYAHEMRDINFFDTTHVTESLYVEGTK
jgi:hypothetical protein